MTEEGNFIGKTSTFPEWVPSNLRSKKLFDSVLEGLYDINNIKYPDKNKKAQRELYDFILTELDSRLGLDTSKIRNKILEQYEPSKKEKVTKPTRKGVKRAKRIS